MKNAEYYNEPEIRRVIEKLKPNNELFEVRLINKGGRKKIISGYFTDADTLIKALDTIDPRSTNMYITINKVNYDCYSREQHDCFRLTDASTHDHEIDAYEWLFIDLDPKRIAEISSSDEELEAARVLSDKVYLYMKHLGFSEPVRAMSGNGHHLLYRIDLPNTDENKALVGRCLENLAAIFDTEKVKIDIVNHNPSRICKLYGTLAQKGSNTETRPHRMSAVTSWPEEIRVNDVNLLWALADELPETKRTATTTPTQNGSFDLEDWLQKYGLETSKVEPGTDCTIYSLANCPFDASHTNGDSKIFKYSNGAIAFKCHHNSCSKYKWQDVRLKLEPEAYDHEDKSDSERIEAGFEEYKQKRAERERKGEIEGGDNGSDSKTKTKAKKERVFRNLKTAEELMRKDLPEPRVLWGVGEKVPLLVEGTCILSAKPKLGKSWLVLGLCLAIAKGEDFLGYKTRKCSALYLDLETSEQLQQKRLKKMLKDEEPPKNFYLETETDNLEDGFIDQIEYYLKQDPNIGIVIIDVFQIIRSAAKSMKETEYAHAYRDITPLTELAQRNHLSILLVCHDRKAVDPDDPFSNILGSTGLQGAASQMIVMFRKRQNDPIHISIKGKTIDGLPEMNVKLEEAVWSVVEGAQTAEQEKAKLDKEYEESNIRKAVVAIIDKQGEWRGRCSALINAGVKCNVGIEDQPKEIGGFLHKHQGRFLEKDHIKMEIISNGSGSKEYTFSKLTVDTVDEIEGLPLMESRKLDEYDLSEVPF